MTILPIDPSDRSSDAAVVAPSAPSFPADDDASLASRTLNQSGQNRPPPPPALRPCSAAHALRTGGYRAWSSRCCAPDGQAVATPGFGEEGASRTLGCQRPSPRASPVCCVQVRSKCEATLWVGGCIWLLKYLDFIYVVLESNKVDRCA